MFRPVFEKVDLPKTCQGPEADLPRPQKRCMSTQKRTRTPVPEAEGEYRTDDGASGDSYVNSLREFKRADVGQSQNEANSASVNSHHGTRAAPH